MYRPAETSRPTLKQFLINVHYPLYVTALVMIGAILCIRLLSTYSWLESAFYGVTLVLAFWLGQGCVGLLQRTQTNRW